MAEPTFPMRCLIVDDNASFLAAARHVLESEEITVVAVASTSADALRCFHGLRPDVTLDELRAWLLAAHQVEASLGLMHKTLARLGLTRTKSRAGPRSRTARTSPSGASPGGPGKAR